MLLAQRDDYIERVCRRPPEAGVGVNLVFVLTRIGQMIRRLRLLHGLSAPEGDGASIRRG